MIERYSLREQHRKDLFKALDAIEKVKPIIGVEDAEALRRNLLIASIEINMNEMIEHFLSPERIEKFINRDNNPQ